MVYVKHTSELRGQASLRSLVALLTALALTPFVIYLPHDPEALRLGLRARAPFRQRYPAPVVTGTTHAGLLPSF